MIEELDDLTLVYMYGAKNGRDSMKDEIDRLRAALREIEWSNDSKWQSDRARAALEGEKTDEN
jgi:hypothetical protein